MDAAKVAAFMCGKTEQSLEEVYGVGLTRGSRLPLIQARGGEEDIILRGHCAGTNHLRDRQ